MTDGEIIARFLSIDKRVSEIERAFREADKRDNGKSEESIIKMDLTLPNADIDGMHFNQTKVRAVFELKEDGWYHSRDILFLSARNVKDDNSRDVLTRYLEIYGESSIKGQIGKSFDVPGFNVELSLPTENEGIKQYNGVVCSYWNKASASDNAYAFCYARSDSFDNSAVASCVSGCAPMFRITEGA